MTKAKLLEQMRSERARWDDVLSRIPRDWMLVPAINNGWSIKDAIGHIAYYEAWVLNWLEAACHGKVKVASHQDLLTVDERNALVWAAHRERNLDELLLESRQTSDRLYQMVKTIPERDLIEPQRFDRYVLPFWGEVLPLWKCIASDSYEHYQEHTASVEQWWQAQRSPGSAAGTPMQDVELVNNI